MVTVAKAMKVLGRTRPTVIKYIIDGKLKAEKVPALRGRKFKYDIDEGSLSKFKLEEAKHIVGITNDKPKISEEEIESFEAFIRDANLDPALAKRFRASAKHLKSSHAQTALKIEQAFSKMKENIISEERYVDLKTFREEIGDSIGLFIDELKSLIDLWQVRYSFSANQLARMKDEFFECCKSVKERLITKGEKEARRIKK